MNVCEGAEAEIAPAALQSSRKHTQVTPGTSTATEQAATRRLRAGLKHAAVQKRSLGTAIAQSLSSVSTRPKPVVTQCVSPSEQCVRFFSVPNTTKMQSLPLYGPGAMAQRSRVVFSTMCVT